MRSKTKTKETVIRRDVRYDGENHYEYELIAAESDRTASWRLTLYSVWTKMTDRDGGESEAKLESAFADAGRAILFYDKVVRNLATPIDLCYALEDERA
jgi:hypothetical protein